MIFNSNKYKVILKPPAKNFSIYFTFGNSFRGDDGVGEYIYRNVKGNSEKYFIVYVGEKWDRIIYLSEKLKPEKIIIIDAANFKDKPGKIKVLPFEKIKSKIKPVNSKIKVYKIIFRISSLTGIPLKKLCVSLVIIRIEIGSPPFKIRKK